MKLFGFAVFVADVPATVAFYERAFGLTLRYLHPSSQYAELETGGVLLAFTGEAMVEGMRLIAGAPFHRNRTGEPPSGAQVAFITEDLEADYRRALAAGAVAVAAPDPKPWGQTLAYVRDNNGFLVELCTPPIR